MIVLDNFTLKLAFVSSLKMTMTNLYEKNSQKQNNVLY